MPDYNRKHIQVEPLDEGAHDVWTFAGKEVQGTKYEFAVTDRNFSKFNRWTFSVRVPDKLVGKAYIQVRPNAHPALKCWADIESKSINFRKATRGNHKSSVYAKVSLADPTGDKTKKQVAGGVSGNFPEWMRKFRLRLKKTVTTTAGTDTKARVVVVGKTDHAEMIRFYIAAKAWVLKEGWVPGED